MYLAVSLKTKTQGTTTMMHHTDSPATPQPSAARQLVVLCDGTNNSVGADGQGTNVLQLDRCLNRADLGQKVFYDPGVGTAANAPGATWVDKLSQLRKRVWGLAFGNGVFENIGEGYAFLMREYHIGDEIYVFGFSRGAFTARGVVGMVNQFGILAPHCEHLLPLMLNIYFSKEGPARSKAAADIRRIGHTEAGSQAKVHFVGVWDTVATVGVPLLDRQFSATPQLVSYDKAARCFKPKKFDHVRQVLALDEHRFTFKPRLYENLNTDCNEFGQSLKQYWVPGAHCDAGGMYTPSPAISHAALEWMVQEASGKGLRASAPRAPENLSTLPTVVHSAVYDNALWAAAGLQVRSTGNDTIRAWPLPALTPGALSYPHSTVWSQSADMDKHRAPRRWWTLLLGVVAMVALYVAMAWALSGMPLDHMGQAAAWASVLSGPWYNIAPEVGRFALWQLHAIQGDGNPIALNPQGLHKTALALDFAYILTYAYVLGRLSSRAFATLAGLRQTDAPARPVLNTLGMALLLMVAADLLENSLHLTLLWANGALWSPLEATLTILLSAAAVAKFAGFAGCLALIGWGAVVRVARSASLEKK
jgi:uncharacterized protein (DUF2235 family)